MKTCPEKGRLVIITAKMTRQSLVAKVSVRRVAGELYSYGRVRNKELTTMERETINRLVSLGSAEEWAIRHG